ncbi:MAG: GNAT family N-acetyltransferase [Candidatus Peribacteraceae bacterium]|nr:GNAT family N-acetyltransferase [Candidatus Peribacteraceae bacterium]
MQQFSIRIAAVLLQQHTGFRAGRRAVKRKMRQEDPDEAAHIVEAAHMMAREEEAREAGGETMKTLRLSGSERMLYERKGLEPEPYYAIHLIRGQIVKVLEMRDILNQLQALRNDNILPPPQYDRTAFARPVPKSDTAAPARLWARRQQVFAAEQTARAFLALRRNPRDTEQYEAIFEHIRSKGILLDQSVTEESIAKRQQQPQWRLYESGGMAQMAENVYYPSFVADMHLHVARDLQEVPPILQLPDQNNGDRLFWGHDVLRYIQHRPYSVAVVEDVCVDPRQRHRGYASALYQAAEEDIAAMNAGRRRHIHYLFAEVVQIVDLLVDGRSVLGGLPPDVRQALPPLINQPGRAKHVLSDQRPFELAWIRKDRKNVTLSPADNPEGYHLEFDLKWFTFVKKTGG